MLLRRHVVPVLGHVRLAALGPLDLQGLYDGLLVGESSLSAGTGTHPGFLNPQHWDATLSILATKPTVAV